MTRKHSHCKCSHRKCSNHKKECCLDTDLAIAKFHEDPSNPIRGKNVLIIGASKGIGLGSAQEFIAAGANVIGTSRKPSDYPTLTFLDPVPLDLTDDASVSNFFATSGVASWSAINVLILGGLIAPANSLAFSKAADIFPFINVELLGRQRVVAHAIQKMKDVDDSRIINLSSIAAFAPLVNAGSYGMCKAAETAWVKQFNLEALWYKKLNNDVDVIKTRAIAWQASWINTSLGQWPATLCPNPGDPIVALMPSGFLAPYLEPSMAGQSQLFRNCADSNLTIDQAGQAMLYMATVRNPEWQYIVISKDEKWCISGDLNCTLRKIIQHKSKDDLTKFVINNTNYNVIYDNILNGGNSEKYSFYKCPPKDAYAPPTPVPAFRPCYPDCDGVSGGCGADPTPFVYNFTVPRNVQDLTNNPCHNNLPCP
jgi:NAD(P)-dependent dehydrogenase (short-subunit alcohol dehydrogenase family)